MARQPTGKPLLKAAKSGFSDAPTTTFSSAALAATFFVSFAALSLSRQFPATGCTMRTHVVRTGSPPHADFFNNQ
jgi:hypothetical protein